MDGRRQVSFIATYSFPYCMLKVVIVATRRRALTCFISCLDRFSILIFLKKKLIYYHQVDDRNDRPIRATMT
jgi:hypothetical protein